MPAPPPDDQDPPLAPEGSDPGPRRAWPVPRLAPRRRLLAVVALVVVLSLFAGVALARRSGVGGRDHAAQSTSTTAPQPVRFAVSTIEANETAPPSPAVIDAVVAQLDTWANAGIVEPLRTGTEAPVLAELFTASARTAATTTERPTFVVVGLPRSRVSVEAATAALTTVAGSDAGTAVVVTTVDLRLAASGPGPRRTTSVVRQGELVWVPEADGVWRIDGWRLHAAEEPRR